MYGKYAFQSKQDLLEILTQDGGIVIDYEGFVIFLIFLWFRIETYSHWQLFVA